MQKHVTDYTKVLSSQTYNKQCVKDIFSIFNKLEWLQQQQLLTDSNIQNLATDITLHILHILQQFAKGFITRTNSNQWKQHVLAGRKYCHFLFFSFVIIFLSSIV